MLEYLVTDKAQQWYSDINYEYAVNPEIKNTAILGEWGEIISKFIDSLARHCTKKYITSLSDIHDLRYMPKI